MKYVLLLRQWNGQLGMQHADVTRKISLAGWKALPPIIPKPLRDLLISGASVAENTMSEA